MAWVTNNGGPDAKPVWRRQGFACQINSSLFLVAYIWHRHPGSLQSYSLPQQNPSLSPLVPIPFVSSHATSLLGLFHAASAGSAEYICKLFSRPTFAGATILFVGGCEGDFFVVCDIQVTIWPDLSKELCSVQIPQFVCSVFSSREI